ncbi:hypothetical protein LWE61_16385 [Sphingobium sufflavum]|uniref:hypothetical protein n=1 Tax=Sphingobium sufflavum TaxID=1129547 RepID=UPI001F2490E1|nr:hypothetical protein [Sphingobium sufflavum]MCE7798122.1 hypothetical protein [Sphingobium sufflavum]
MMSAVLDEHLGIVRSVSIGFTADDEVQTYADQMLAFKSAAKRKSKPFLHLVDARHAQVHSKEAAAVLNALAAEWHDPKDRTAVIVESSLQKMQMNRTSTQAGAFGSEEAALQWLLDPNAVVLERVRAT